MARSYSDRRQGESDGQASARACVLQTGVSWWCGSYPGTCRAAPRPAAGWLLSPDTQSKSRPRRRFPRPGPPTSETARRCGFPPGQTGQRRTGQRMSPDCTQTDNRWTGYQADVRSGLPQGRQGAAGRLLKRFVPRQLTERGELQDEGPHAGGARDGRLRGTDSVQEVHRSVRHAGGRLKGCRHPQHITAELPPGHTG